MYISLSLYIYIYIYISVERELWSSGGPRRLVVSCRRLRSHPTKEEFDQNTNCETNSAASILNCQPLGDQISPI